MSFEKKKKKHPTKQQLIKRTDTKMTLLLLRLSIMSHMTYCITTL